MLASNRRSRWGLLSMIMIVSLVCLWVGNQILHAQPSKAILPLPFNERVSMDYVPASGSFEVSGWLSSELQQVEALVVGNMQWADVLSIHIVLPDQSSDGLPSIIGDYTVSSDGTTLVFQPTYGWSAGQSYTAILDLSMIREISLSTVASQSNALEWSFVVPASVVPDEQPRVTTIYPTADQIPENLLRFYIEFSQPMQRGNVYDLVQLLDGNGNEVEWPFLRIGQEFWDREMRVLTIILDPGRIKQGVAPNVEAGAPLESDGNYQLLIGADLRDAYGRPMEQTVVKSFTVITPDYQSPDPNLWTLSSPAVGSREALTIELDAAIDPILAPRLIRLEDESGQPIATTFSISDGELLLHFIPAEAWSRGKHRLAIYPTLEDYAGNRVESLFDMAPGTVAELAVTNKERESIYIDFELGDSR